jgi:hypothetical protein
MLGAYRKQIAGFHTENQMQLDRPSIMRQVGTSINTVRRMTLNEATLSATGDITVTPNMKVSDCLESYGMCQDLAENLQATYHTEYGLPDLELLTLNQVVDAILRARPRRLNVGI